jgi:fructosamine-3-kinase
MNFLVNHIEQRLSRQLKRTVQVLHQTQVFGGDINQAFHLQTNIGSFFLKLNNGSLKDMFEKEFNGLQVLYQTKTIRIPEPVLYGSFEDQVFLITHSYKKEVRQKTFGRYLHNSLLHCTNILIRYSGWQLIIISAR